jgi:hypothetical protein
MKIFLVNLHLLKIVKRYPALHMNSLMCFIDILDIRHVRKITKSGY